MDVAFAVAIESADDSRAVEVCGGDEREEGGAERDVGARLLLGFGLGGSFFLLAGGFLAPQGPLEMALGGGKEGVLGCSRHDRLHWRERARERKIGSRGGRWPSWLCEESRGYKSVFLG